MTCSQRICSEIWSGLRRDLFSGGPILLHSSNPNISFLSLVSVLFRRPPTFGVLAGGENSVSQGTISYGPSKDHILVHKIQLKPMIKAYFSGRMVSSGIISVVAFASEYKSQQLMVFSGTRK